MTHAHGPVYLLSTCRECRVAKVHASRPSRARQDLDIWYISFYHNISQQQIISEVANANQRI
jgi:hypothetical protein